MLLYEFAMTPDVFDPSVVGVNPALRIVLVELLRGMCENGLVANLHQAGWHRHIRQRLEELSPNLRRDIIECLNTLYDRHRLVAHPRRVAGDPANDADWLDLALESHRRSLFRGIVLSQALRDSCPHCDPAFMELSVALDSPLWRERQRSHNLVQREADYRAALTPILRHARALTLVDPYINCHEARYQATIRYCIELLGQRGYNVLPGRIHIHAGDPTNRRLRHHESVPDRLNAWESYLRRFIGRYPHRFKVFLWRKRRGGERFHDRYILTDQCGISVAAGLDCDAHSQHATTWMLLDERDRQLQLQKHDPPTSPFDLLGTREIR